MTTPCSKPSNSFLLIQSPSSFTDPGIFPNSMSNHIPYLSTRNDSQNTLLFSAHAIPDFLLGQNFILSPTSDSLKHSGSPWPSPAGMNLSSSITVYSATCTLSTFGVLLQLGVCVCSWAVQSMRARRGSDTFSSPPQFSARVSA